MKKEAVIFDLDGTLINSIPFHFKIRKKAFAKYKIDLTRKVFEKYHNGRNSHEGFVAILKHITGSTDLLEKVLTESKKLTKEANISSIKVFPGVKSTLKKLKKAGYKLAVASSSNDNYVRERLKDNQIKHYFDTIIGANHVKHSKPNPAIFLEAWKQINIPKSKCIIIEDTTNGAIAAKRAKIDCICVLTSEKEKELPNFVRIAKKHSMLFDLINNQKHK